jgi:hypothetical protein
MRVRWGYAATIDHLVRQNYIQARMRTNDVKFVENVKSLVFQMA